MGNPEYPLIALAPLMHYSPVNRYETQTQRECAVRGSNVKDTNDAAIKVSKLDTVIGYYPVDNLCKGIWGSRSNVTDTHDARRA